MPIGMIGNARFVQRLDIARQHEQVLVWEFVEDDWCARWKMLLWPRQRSVMMQSHIITHTAVATPGAPLVYGPGAGGFSATRKGETAVPTKGMLRELHRTARCLRDRNPIHVNSELDEHMTSKTCHKCGGRMNDVRDADAKVVRGIKFCGCCGDDRHAHVLWSDTNGTCSYCRRPARGLRSDGQTLQGLRWCIHTRDEMHVGKFRNQDVNAAKNLWKVLFALSND